MGPISRHFLVRWWGGCKINLATKLCGKVYQIFNAENGFLADFTSSSLTSQAFVSFCYVL